MIYRKKKNSLKFFFQFMKFLLKYIEENMSGKLNLLKKKKLFDYSSEEWTKKKLMLGYTNSDEEKLKI